jgi:hypothetical protein
MNVRILEADQVRMGQGLLGMVRNIGAALGVTVTSVIFERRRTYHQLAAYVAYDATSLEHARMSREIGLTLRSSGIDPSQIGTMTLGTIRRQMDTEAIAAGFRDSFFAIGFCFLLAMLSMCFLSSRYMRK